MIKGRFRGVSGVLYDVVLCANQMTVFSVSVCVIHGLSYSNFTLLGDVKVRINDSPARGGFISINEAFPSRFISIERLESSISLNSLMDDPYST